MVNRKLNFSLSKTLIYFIAIVWLAVFFVIKPWQKNQVTNDVVSYYGYLPATFIYSDLTLEFASRDAFFGDKFWPKTAPNGAKVIKMSMGLSMMYAPFFFMAHITAPLFDQPQDGYSTPYQVWLMLSCLFYLLAGLFYLRKILLLYFSEKISALTIASVFFGTNLLWYSTVDGLMSHGYLFCMLTVFIYHIIRWHEQPVFKRLIYIGLIGGLITLIRPTMILCFLFFIFYGVYNKQTLIEKTKLLLKHIPGLAALSLCFLLIQLPQLIYWKYITGNWFFFSYVGERFYFDNPHILEGLAGFRKGWLVYTPIMLFALAGFVSLSRNMKQYRYAISIPFLLSIYVMFSWWCWWYGGSFGQRPLVDFYGMLALPMARFYKQIFESGKRIVKITAGIIILLLIALNLFQTKQYNEGLIHYDAMTKEAYMKGFFASHSTAEWYQALDEPDYDRLVLGLPEIISNEELKQLKPSDKISLKGANLRNVSSEIASTTELTSSRFTMDAWERFSLIHITENKVALKADNGKYVCADRDNSWKLFANRDNIGAWETFELTYPGNNRIALKADNGKYVSVNEEFPNILVAKADTITSKELFRIYINGKK